MTRAQSIVDFSLPSLTTPKRIPRWRHQMETVSALQAICAGNSPVTGEFPSQRPVTRSLDVIKWKHFLHKDQWRGALMFSLICAWINGWVNNRDAGDLRRHCTHYDVSVMILQRRIFKPLRKHKRKHYLIVARLDIMVGKYRPFFTVPNILTRLWSAGGNKIKEVTNWWCLEYALDICGNMWKYHWILWKKITQ